MKDQILLLDKIVKTYPGVIALDNVSLGFNKGEIHSIVGENGAGKSTLIKIISGAISADTGEIIIEGEKYSHLSPLQAKNLGIEVVYQEFNLVESLSVAENVFLGERNSRLYNKKKCIAKAEQLFRDFNFNIDVRKKIDELSPAQMQLTEIIKIAYKQAKLLILDEPTAPLSASEVEQMYEIIKKIRDNGTTIIYISHRLEEIFKISDRVSVLRDGKYIGTLDISDTNRNKLIKMMVGREISENYPKRTKQYTKEALRVENLSGNGVNDISFSVRKGEILGFAGLVGAGRTEMAMALFGAAKKNTGKIYIDEVEVKIVEPYDAISNGIGLIPEDRKKTGCLLDNTISFNLSMASIKSLSKGIIINDKKEKEICKFYVDTLNIKTPSYEQYVRNLSGGNQQKVVVGKTLAAKSKIIIFDEPTRGIDVGAKMEIYELMNDLANKGNSILMISSDLVELIGMSDRIIVISEGHLVGELSSQEFSQEKIIDLASGNN